MTTIHPDTAQEAPSYEWYRELRETEVELGGGPELASELGRAFGFIDACNAIGLNPAALAAAIAQPPAPWRCHICGGPRTVPSLTATLGFACGYAASSGDTWTHA